MNGPVINGTMTLPLLGNTLLRTAVKRNLVSFPAQVQPFMKRSSGDLQKRIVQLYFVRGWSVRNICRRYGLNKAMAHKLLAEWRVRAVESGYIQEIAPGMLDALAQEAHPEESSANVSVAQSNKIFQEFTGPNTMHLEITLVPIPGTLSVGSRV
jgi:transposase-like protein